MCLFRFDSSLFKCEVMLSSISLNQVAESNLKPQILQEFNLKSTSVSSLIAENSN